MNRWRSLKDFQGDKTMTQKDIIWQIKNTGIDRSKYFGNNWISVNHNNKEYNDNNIEWRAKI